MKPDGTTAINDYVTCEGSLTAISAISLNAGLMLGGNGAVNLGGGALYCKGTASGMQGGILSVYSQYIGNSGAGTFNHLSGTNTISYNLSITSGGAYILHDSGILAASLEYVGNSGAGTFTQTGGINQVITSLVLASSSSSSQGTYNLNGGTLILKSLFKGPGTATFNFGCGTLQASNSFSTSLPMTLTGDGGDANLDTAGYSVVLTGALSGPGGLNKDGEGTLILSGPLSYTGITTINDGTLAINNGSVNTLSTISGVGNLTVSGTTTLNATSIYVGTLTIDSSFAVAVPEPSTLVLLGIGAIGLLLYCRRRQ